MATRSQTPQARRPEGEAVDGVYRRYPPAGAQEASPTGVTSPSRDETGPAGETIPLDATVAHGVTRMTSDFPLYLMNKRPTGL